MTAIPVPDESVPPLRQGKATAAGNASPVVRHLKASKAARARFGRDTTGVDRDLAAEVLAEHVARIVAAAPPLTAAQRARVAALLRPARAEPP